jgi:hypothetical protein
MLGIPGSGSIGTGDDAIAVHPIDGVHQVDNPVFSGAAFSIPLQESG